MIGPLNRICLISIIHSVQFRSRGFSSKIKQINFFVKLSGNNFHDEHDHIIHPIKIDDKRLFDQSHL